MNKLKYFFEVIGPRKLLIFVLLRPFRAFLLMKDLLFKIYREKVYAEYIFQYFNYNKIDLSEKEYSQKISDYYQSFGKSINPYWHYCYAHASGIYSEKYVPEILYYEEIEPVLNRAEMAKGYDDKNIYDQLFKGTCLPRSILRCINGVYYDQHYNRIDGEDDVLGLLTDNTTYIMKPSLDGQGGKGVEKGVYSDGKMFTSNQEYDVLNLRNSYRKDFIIQNVVVQHENLSKIYPKAVNTIRIISFREAKKVRVLSSIIRFGNNGSFVDNESSGGLSCGINADGTLKGFAVGKKLDVYHKHPYTNEEFKGVEIPGFEQAKQMAIKLHHKLYYFKIASWDIAISETRKPVLIEMNLMEQGINFHQATNGPLFGDLTDEILSNVYK